MRFLSYKILLVTCHVVYLGGEIVFRAESPPYHQDSEKDYEEEARRIRAIATHLKDSLAQAQLLVIASLYEKLANLVRNESKLLSDKVP